MWHVTPYQPVDYLDANAWSLAATVPGVVPSGPGYTARLHGQVLACAGIQIPWPGLGEAWAVIAPEGRRYPRYVHFAVRSGMRRLIAEHGLRRVEATVALDFDEGHRWVTLLGFVEDGIADGYLPDGGDAMRYVLRVKP